VPGKFRISQKFLKIFCNTPIDLYGREALAGKTGPPLPIRGQQKACFLQLVADRRLFIGRKGKRLSDSLPG
jgi:hypothetical protein